MITVLGCLNDVQLYGYTLPYLVGSRQSNKDPKSSCFSWKLELDYANSVNLLWLTNQKICTKLNKCIRSMLFAHGREHINPCHNLLGILKLENIYRLKIALFAYKIKNDKSNTPVVLLNILTPASEIH